MMNRLFLAVVVVLGLVPGHPAFADGEPLDGLWKSASGAVYRYVQRGETVVATYEVPTAAQVAAGIRKGDLALKGTYVANVLSATYYQRAPLEVQALCPEYQIIDGSVNWELQDDVLSGALVLVFGTDDTCQVTNRRIQQIRLERVPGPPGDTFETAPKVESIPWPFPW